MATKKRGTRKSRLPLFAGGIVVALIALAGFAWMSGKKANSTTPFVSATPVMIDSVAQSLEPFRGKVVILDIWATWCGPCRVEIPDFIKLQEKYRSSGLEIVGVSIDPIDARGGGQAAVAPFVQSSGINYTIWMINNGAALGSYPMGQGIPTTYIIDRNGRTVQKYVGAQPMSRFENDIKALL
jgi:thiol-disulfide isomerase/thioredoxin